ncbi:hypothetical protein ZWY2020_020354 [Hordeum vulgare]|nr:hypothetical protein ZWY2020_020354 [Hordeum vulgare]
MEEERRLQAHGRNKRPREDATPVSAAEEMRESDLRAQLSNRRESRSVWDQVTACHAATCALPSAFQSSSNVPQRSKGYLSWSYTLPINHSKDLLLTSK